MQVSHETIYRSLFVQSRGVLKRELLQQLRRQRRFRQRPRVHSRASAAGTSSTPSRSANGRRTSPIARSPAIGKATCSPARSARISSTLVERQSRYVMLVRVPNKETHDGRRGRSRAACVACHRA